MRDYDGITLGYRDGFNLIAMRYPSIGKFGKRNRFLREASRLMTQNLCDTLFDLKDAVLNAYDTIFNVKDGKSPGNSLPIINAVREVAALCRSGRKMADNIDAVFGMEKGCNKMGLEWARAQRALVNNDESLVTVAAELARSLDNNFPKDWEEICRSILDREGERL